MVSVERPVVYPIAFFPHFAQLIITHSHTLSHYYVNRALFKEPIAVVDSEFLYHFFFMEFRVKIGPKKE